MPYFIFSPRPRLTPRASPSVFFSCAFSSPATPMPHTQSRSHWCTCAKARMHARIAANIRSESVFLAARYVHPTDIVPGFHVCSSPHAVCLPHIVARVISDSLATPYFRWNLFSRLLLPSCTRGPTFPRSNAESFACPRRVALSYVAVGNTAPPLLMAT